MTKTIVVVDDDQSFREFMQDALSVAGYRVVVLAHSDHVPGAVVQHRADLVILDFVMPHRTGPEVVAELEVLHLDVPVLLVTGLALDNRSLGGVRLLRKPFDLLQLYDTVQELLGETT